MVWNDLPSTSAIIFSKQQYVSNVISVSHTMYSTSWTSRTWTPSSFFVTFSGSFSERGFNNYLQHFVVMDVSLSHLSLCFFTCAKATFWEQLLLVLSDSSQFWKNSNMLCSQDLRFLAKPRWPNPVPPPSSPTQRKRAQPPSNRAAIPEPSIITLKPYRPLLRLPTGTMDLDPKNKGSPMLVTANPWCP